VRQDRELAAQRVVEAARARGVRATFLIWEGRPATALMEAAAAERVDLIVMGSHGRGRVGRLIYGSVSQAVARDAPCPVMVVRPGARPVMLRAGTRAVR
jgi:nucleotide-binding universal stress UspA family protein